MVVRKDLLEPLTQQPATSNKLLARALCWFDFRHTVSSLALPRVLIAYYFHLIASILASIVRAKGVDLTHFLVASVRAKGFCLVFDTETLVPWGGKHTYTFRVGQRQDSDTVMRIFLETTNMYR